MRLTTSARIVGACLALSGAAWAQGPDAPPPAPTRDLAAEWKALQAEYAAAEAEFWRPLREAKTDEEREKIQIDWEKRPATRFVPRVRAFADRAKRTEAALDALLWLLEEDTDEGAATTLVRRVLADHATSPGLERLAGWLTWGAGELPEGEGERALRGLMDKSPHRPVKAAAAFALANLLASPDAPPTPTPERKAEALRLLDGLSRDFADTEYAAQAKGLRFELTRLQVGMVAPDFEATDQDGKSFKLSDYRGKVVVVDFWGYW